MDLEQELTPRRVVAELDKYIVGQAAAKRAVAVALRDRWRRAQLPVELGREILPKNILMIGPTGVGKTEIARRIARLVKAPFIKVEATKFTEVGYVGRDVESMIRDLVHQAVNQVRAEEEEKVRGKAAERVEERILDLLLPGPSRPAEPGERETSRDRLRRLLKDGALDERTIEIETPVRTFPKVEVMTPQGMEEMDLQMQNMLGNLFPKRTERRLATVAEAREQLLEEESGRLVDAEAVKRTAVQRVEESGIVFLDELDKVAGSGEGQAGPDVSREGVQRDLLPLLGGSTVNTRYGLVRTDHVLFIAAGAFHISKPSDLIPELQGRLPIRVELDDLGVDEFVQILSESGGSPIRHAAALLGTEGLTVDFTEDGIRAIAETAARVNEETENIGARRLHTVIERLLEEVSFDAPERKGETVKVDAAMVRDRLKDVVEDTDLSRYIL
ncbi:MAG: ATP-dependent protease ATPase subunit HslU [Deltaproteobacteria bacterium]|nr:ATP-dependent protease ATPase subunit HslU [Deltaproteobacteria bacterium]